MKCVEDSPYPVLHVRPKSRPPTPDPYGVPPNARKQKKLEKIAVKKSLRIPELKEAMPLQMLDVSRNSFTCQGFASFLSCLARRGIQDTLLTLDVSRTNVAVAGGRVLAQFLGKCLFIQRVDCRCFVVFTPNICHFRVSYFAEQPHSNGRRFSQRIFACHAQQRPELSVDTFASPERVLWNWGWRCPGFFFDNECPASGLN